MSLDTSTYVGGFDTAKPAGADPKSDGDDNFRHIKTVLKTSFPNVTGAVTATHTQMNYLVGVTSAIQTQFTAKAPLASPTLTGVPAAPTAAGGTNTTQIATTAFVATSFAPLASPALTGTPTAPTAAGGTNTTQIATTAFVTAASLTSVVPVSAPDSGKYLTNNGTVANWGDPFASPALTGNPTAPTPAANDNDTSIATTAFVDTSFAKKASPTFTGVPLSTTAAAGTNTTQIATTAFVTGAVGGYAADAIGTYVFGKVSSAGLVALGSTIAGSAISATSILYSGNGNSGATLSGTWRVMGYIGNGTNECTLFLRIS
jgi:hypothetical protein